MGLAVYKKFDGHIPPGQDTTQILHDSDTDRIVPNNSLSLDVEPPTCDSQIDLFHGQVIQGFAPGQQYGSRKLDFGQVDNVGFCGPKAVDNNGTTDQGSPITIDVAANHTDGDGNLDPRSLSVKSSPSHGWVMNNGDGTITSTPDPGFTGDDTFEYNICNDDNRCASLLGVEGTVTITVTQTTLAVDDAYSVPESQGAPQGVLQNDMARTGASCRHPSSPESPTVR